MILGNNDQNAFSFNDGFNTCSSSELPTLTSWVFIVLFLFLSKFQTKIARCLFCGTTIHSYTDHTHWKSIEENETKTIRRISKTALLDILVFVDQTTAAWIVYAWIDQMVIFYLWFCS